MRFFTLCSLIVSCLFSPHVFSQPITAMVDGGQNKGKKLQCQVYLQHLAPAVKTEGKKTILFQQGGTGVYTNYFDKLQDGIDYFLTLDKPGISPDLKNKDRTKPIVDRSSFDYYTMDNLIQCAENALNWADNYLNHVDKMIILQGHSEGTIVMSSLVLRGLNNNSNPKLLNEIKALFLSGVVMKNMPEVLRYQLQEIQDENLSYDQMINAYKSRDFDFVYKNFGVGWYWLENVFTNKTRGLDAIFADIAKSDQGRTLPIEIFQGLNDKDIKAKWTLEFETKNKEEPINKKLNLNARYYNADHSLNETAIADIMLKRDYYFKH
ncbi:MAG: hypothetical protein H0U73_07350 [Tatlockia sp.]|nr:hypothetical protein [Tatlockia sp.]